MRQGKGWCLERLDKSIARLRRSNAGSNNAAEDLPNMFTKCRGQQPFGQARTHHKGVNQHMRQISKKKVQAIQQ